MLLEETCHLQLGARQREALELLKGTPEGLDTAALDDRGIGAATLKRLVALGLVAISRRRIDRDPFEQRVAAVTAREPLVLTEEQAAAFERLSALASPGDLPDGPAARRDRQRQDRAVPEAGRDSPSRGRGVLMLVPEIALTPAVAAIFRATFGDRVAIQHSGLSDGERHDQWQRIRRGDVDVVVGTRSAVFAPIAIARAHHRRRGARRILQAGREPALPRPRRRGRARRAGGRARRARLGDAVDGELSQRAERPLRR